MWECILTQGMKAIREQEICIALSHARRFGKSHAAGMIDAYYSRGCDSSKLFDDTKIAESDDYRRYSILLELFQKRKKFTAKYR